LKMDENNWEEDLRAARGEMLDTKTADGKDAYAAAVARNNAIEKENWEDNMAAKRERDAEEREDFARNPKRGVFRRYVDRKAIREADEAWAEAREGPFLPKKPKKPKKYNGPMGHFRLPKGHE